MKPLLNASKTWQNIPGSSLKKREPSIKHKKSKLGLVTKFDKPRTSSSVKRSSETTW